MYIIKTERLTFRPLQESDSQSVLTAAQETHNTLYKWYGGTLTQSNLSEEIVKDFIKECLKSFIDKSFIQFGVFDNTNNEFIGIGSLHHLDWTVPKGRIGYWVRTSEQGRGYATEIANILTRLSFEKLGLKRLEIRASVDNKPSSAVPKKLGYKFLTIFEKNKKGNDGSLWDLEIYVRLNADNLPPIEVNYFDKY